VYQLGANGYQKQTPNADNHYWIEELGLYLGVWWGKRTEMTANWLRWWDSSGNLLRWGQELLEQERQRTELESQRAEQIAGELEQERQSRQLLVAKLRELGVEVDRLS
jgi:hypothetical protein